MRHCSFYRAMHYSAKRGLAIACRLSVCLSVCPSVTLVDHNHIGWKSWKLIARTISPTSSLFVAQRSSTYSQWNMQKFGGENVRSTPTSITSSWIESTESHVILGGDVAVCLLLSAHRAVNFAIAQHSFSFCYLISRTFDTEGHSDNLRYNIICSKLCQYKRALQTVFWNVLIAWSMTRSLSCKDVGSRSPRFTERRRESTR